jgi:hypothetical protein
MDMPCTVHGMAKKNLHILMDEALADAIARYAKGHGISFAAALAVLATRGLRSEGIILTPREGQS